MRSSAWWIAMGYAGLVACSREETAGTGPTGGDNDAGTEAGDAASQGGDAGAGTGAGGASGVGGDGGMAGVGGTGWPGGAAGSAGTAGSGADAGSAGAGGSAGDGGAAGTGGSAGAAGAGGTTTYGWDYNLAHECASTTGQPGDANYYRVDADCPANAPGWLLVVESENGASQSCSGPINRSFPINAADSPVSLSFTPHQSALGPNWTVNMKVDHASAPHPCGPGYFTFFAFMDHVGYGGGPFPLPRETRSHHTLSYSYFAPSPGDAARTIVAGQFWWDGKARLVEIHVGSVNWGDAVPADPCTVLAAEWTPELTFVSLEGSCFGLALPPGTDTSIDVTWKEPIDYCVAKSYFPAPASWSQTAVQALYVAVEAKNGAVADLWQTDFRVDRAP